MILLKEFTAYSEVTSVSIKDQDVLMVKKSAVYFNDEMIFESRSECFSGFAAKDWIYFSDENRHFLKSLEGKTYNYSKGYSPLWNTFNETDLTVIVGTNYRFSGGRYGVMDLSLLDIGSSNLKSLNITYPFPSPVDNVYLPFQTSDRQVDVYNIKSGSIITILLDSETGRWYNSFDKKWVDGTINHIVGVIDEILWIDISKGVLAGFDITTGQLKHCLQKAFQKNNVHSYPYWELPQFAHTTYDVGSHQLIGLFSDRYWVVDLNQKDLSLDMWVLHDEFEHYNIALRNSDRRTITDSHVFFLDSHTSQIGALNRRSLHLDDIYRFDSQSFKNVLMRVESTDKNIYVLDNGGTLHVFEIDIL